MKYDISYVRQLEIKNKDLYAEILRLKKTKLATISKEVLEENKLLKSKLVVLRDKLSQIEEICFTDVLKGSE